MTAHSSLDRRAPRALQRTFERVRKHLLLHPGDRLALYASDTQVRSMRADDVHRCQLLALWCDLIGVYDASATVEQMVADCEATMAARHGER